MNSTPEASPALERLDTHFCPKCDSAAVSLPSLEGGTASCRTCKHEGSVKDFPIYPVFVPRGQTPASLMQQMADTLRVLVGQSLMTPMLSFLDTFGFLPWDTSAGILACSAEEKEWRKRVITIYFKAAGRSMLRGFIEARELIEPIRIEHEKYLSTRGKLGN